MEERWSDDVDGKKTMVRCVVCNKRVKVSSNLSYAARCSSTQDQTKKTYGGRQLTPDRKGGTELGLTFVVHAQTRIHSGK